MTEREVIEKCREHYSMMSELFDRLDRGDTVEVNGRTATYADWSKEMRAGMALCARTLAT